MLCINLYGSGIPIKVIEAIDESKSMVIRLYCPSIQLHQLRALIQYIVI